MKKWWQSFCNHKRSGGEIRYEKWNGMMKQKRGRIFLFVKVESLDGSGRVSEDGLGGACGQGKDVER